MSMYAMSWLLRAALIMKMRIGGVGKHGVSSAHAIGALHFTGLNKKLFVLGDVEVSSQERIDAERSEKHRREIAIPKNS